MCRFLLAKSKDNLSPESILNQFADMCRDSQTEEGDWQGDGWGVAWINGTGYWDARKSLKPIWEDREQFKKIPETAVLVAHARSASFPEQRGVIDFNEPYLKGDYCYVFNGMLKGVRLKEKGRIGAQKVWTLLQKELVSEKPLGAMENAYEKLTKNSREIKGLNIGLVSKDNFFVLCGKHGNGNYFTLRKLTGDELTIVCSEDIGDYRFEKMNEGEFIAL